MTDLSTLQKFHLANLYYSTGRLILVGFPSIHILTYLISFSLTDLSTLKKFPLGNLYYSTVSLIITVGINKAYSIYHIYQGFPRTDRQAELTSLIQRAIFL